MKRHPIRKRHPSKERKPAGGKVEDRERDMSLEKLDGHAEGKAENDDRMSERKHFEKLDGAWRTREIKTQPRKPEKIQKSLTA